jgi:hypothetical protein
MRDIDMILGDLAVTIIKGPLGVLLGVVYGFGAGTVLWYLPGKDSVSELLNFVNSILPHVLPLLLSSPDFIVE